MVGTGKGLLQPTKPITTDDYVEALAPPGYQQKFVLCADAAIIASSMPNPAAVLFVVPDGLTAEIVDVGFTWPHAFTFTGSNKVALQFAVMDSDGTASQQIVDSFERVTAVTAGLTLSAARGTLTYSTASNTAAKRTLAAGSIISVGIDQTGTTGDGANFVAWVRVKWTAKDRGTI